MWLNRLSGAAYQTGRNLWNVIPFIVGVLLLISILDVVIPPAWYARYFTGIGFIDAVIGAAAGSVAAGHPLTSYIIGGELLARGVSFVAVVAFLLSWVTVGVVQLPAEGAMLGWRFALVRNGINFGLAIVVALLVTFTMKLLA